MSDPTPSIHERDESVELAALLGLDPERFRELFGACWVRNDAPVWHDHDADPSGGLDAEVTPWHISGQPAQLMLRVFEHGVFLASPSGHWADLGRMEYHPSSQVHVPAYELDERVPETVKRLQTARRRSFRYCRYCRVATPPEHRIDDDTCHTCASVFEGVVF